jgi:hypothetical protein
MKRNSLGTVVAAIACLGISFPSACLAAAPGLRINDVALQKDGVLVGQVVDQQGVGKARKLVSIQYGDHEVARTETDENGFFAAKGLRGGQYQLSTDEGTSHYRLWAQGTAPPVARPTAMVISGHTVVRGAGPHGGWISWMKAHPYMTATAVAAAIAIPLAVADDDWDGC